MTCDLAGWWRRYSAHVKSQREAAMPAADSSMASGGQPAVPKGSQSAYHSYDAGHAPKAEV